MIVELKNGRGVIIAVSSDKEVSLNKSTLLSLIKMTISDSHLSDYYESSTEFDFETDETYGIKFFSWDYFIRDSRSKRVIENVLRKIPNSFVFKIITIRFECSIKPKYNYRWKT